MVEVKSWLLLMEEEKSQMSTPEGVSVRQRVRVGHNGLWGHVLTSAGTLTVEPVQLLVASIIRPVKRAYCSTQLTPGNI